MKRHLSSIVLTTILISCRTLHSGGEPTPDGHLRLPIDMQRGNLIEICRTSQEPKGPMLVFIKANYGSPAWRGHWTEMPTGTSSVLLYQEQVRNLVVVPTRRTPYHVLPHQHVRCPLEITECKSLGGPTLTPNKHLTVATIDDVDLKQEKVIQWLRAGVRELNKHKTTAAEKEIVHELYPGNPTDHLARERDLRQSALAAFRALLTQLNTKATTESPISNR